MSNMANHRTLDQITFFSFGMFIIDEIVYTDNSKPAKHNLPGGAGLYALLGARLLCPPPHSQSLSWILDAGSDFPSDIAHQIRSWQTSTTIRHDASRLTTRAWNGYGGSANGNVDADAEHRAFEYLTPKRRLDVEDLDARQACGRSWHLVCSPARCVEVVRKLERRRQELRCRDGKVVVWEPIPDLCTPEELHGVRIAAGMVDVVSPNAEELRAFFDSRTDDEKAYEQDELVSRFMGWDTNGDEEERKTWHTACVVREGKRGSTLYFPPGRPLLVEAVEIEKVKLRKVHLPAYHDASMSGQVVDPTGGGNTYLGALAVAMAYTHPSTAPAPSKSTATTTISPPTKTTTTTTASPPNPISMIQNYTSNLTSSNQPRPPPPQFRSLLTAALCACIAASFAIEQNGVPALTPAIGDDGTEKWGRLDSLTVTRRVEMYLDREGEGVRRQVREIDFS